LRLRVFETSRWILKILTPRLEDSKTPKVLEVRQDVWEFQLIQETLTHFRIILVTPPTCDRPQLELEVARQFANKFGDEVTTEVCFVNAIDRTAAGKHRLVMSLLRQSKLRLSDTDKNEV
jgi:hypothetical protein